MEGVSAGAVQKEPKWKTIFYDPKWRAVLSQILLISLVIWGISEIVGNVLRNLEERNISSGFGFIDTTAGFAIIQTLVPYSETSSYGRAFVVGVLNTVLIAIIGILFATILGFTIGIMRLSKNWLAAKIATIYIETIRNIPLLLQIFIWYHAVLKPLPTPRDSITIGESVFLNNRGLYMPEPIFGNGTRWVVIAILITIAAMWQYARYAKQKQIQTGQILPVFLPTLIAIITVPFLTYLVFADPITFEYPQLKGFNFRDGIVLIPEFISMLLALSLYTAAFIAEVVRAGIQAVPYGQTEASQSLGVPRKVTLRKIIIPQAMRVIIPPLANQYLNLTKNSSLAAAIAYPELVSIGGTILNQTGQAIEIIGMWMFIYLFFSLTTAAIMNWWNKKMKLVER